VTGEVGGKTVDADATCSEATFDCVIDSSEAQFPARDPSAGQITQRLGRALPRAEDAADSADNAQTIAVAALVAALLALLVALTAGFRTVRRKDG
jgi:hypothetical protein